MLYTVQCTLYSVQYVREWKFNSLCHEIFFFLFGFSTPLFFLFLILQHSLCLHFLIPLLPTFLKFIFIFYHFFLFHLSLRLNISLNPFLSFLPFLLFFLFLLHLSLLFSSFSFIFPSIFPLSPPPFPLFFLFLLHLSILSSSFSFSNFP